MEENSLSPHDFQTKALYGNLIISTNDSYHFIWLLFAAHFYVIIISFLKMSYTELKCHKSKISNLFFCCLNDYSHNKTPKER